MRTTKAQIALGTNANTKNNLYINKCLMRWIKKGINADQAPKLNQHGRGNSHTQNNIRRVTKRPYFFFFNQRVQTHRTRRGRDGGGDTFFGSAVTMASPSPAPAREGWRGDGAEEARGGYWLSPSRLWSRKIIINGYEIMPNNAATPPWWGPRA